MAKNILEQYKSKVAKTKNLKSITSDFEQVSYLSVGLAGEIGEVLNMVKKDLFYDDYDLDRDVLLDEFGDCLYFLTNLIAEYGFDLEDAMKVNMRKVTRMQKIFNEE